MKRHLLIIFLFLLTVIPVYTQIKLSGTVFDASNGTSLPGVTIMEQGTKNGTVTDIDGNFSIKVKSEGSVISFSYVGMTPKYVIVDKERVLRVEMELLSKDLNEVVIIGYGETRRRDVVSSQSSLNSQDIKKSKGSSFMEAMQGRVAGVQVTSNSGEPGSDIDITIRGGNSINAGTQPLYIIDDVQIDINQNEIGVGSYTSANAKYNPLSGINPNDIESIRVLKDASATAIYGSRGANGVILVTTKSGGGEKTSVDLDVNMGVSSVTKKLNMLKAQDYADYRYAKAPGGSDWGMDTNGDGQPDQPKDVSDYEQHDWQDEILRNAINQSYSLGITTGGNTKTKMSSSFGYFNQEGIVDKNKYERYTARIKASTDIDSKLTLGANVNLSYAKTTGAATTSGENAYNGVIQGLLLYKPVFATTMADDASNAENYNLTNPITFLNDAYKTVPLTRTITDIFANYKILKNLTLRVSGGGTLTESKGEEWYPSTTSWGYTKKGLAAINETNTFSWQTSNTLTYAKFFKKKHYINVIVGFELGEYTLSSFSVRAEGFEDQNYIPVFDIGQASVYPTKVQSNKERNTRESEFGRLNYTLKDRYLFMTTIRRDGTSKFGENNKYAYFPSGAFAWKIDQESFMRKQRVFNELKLRLSYGVTGNDRITSYRSLSRTDKTYYGANNNSATIGLSPSEVPNPDLKWETTYQMNAGMDIQMFKGRIGLVFDLYKKETKDMLLHADIPSQSGSYRQWQNIGRVDNQGIEIALNTVNVKTKNFTWISNINFNINKNKVKSLGSVSSIPVSVQGGDISEVGRIMVGYPIGSGWGYVYDGIYQQTDFNADGTLKDGIASFSGVTVKPGDMKFKNLDGDVNNIVDPENDKTVISNSQPDNYGGFNNTFSYKGFDLSIFLQWSYGNDIINIGRYRYEGYVGTSNTTYDYWENRWTPENPTNKYPALNGKGKTESSSYYVEDGSYLRLKNITFGYNLPSKTCNKIKIQSLRFYCTAENLATWTNYTGFDPEVSYWNKLITGLDYTSYPRAKLISVGLSVKY